MSELTAEKNFKKKILKSTRRKVTQHLRGNNDKMTRLSIRNNASQMT